MQELSDILKGPKRFHAYILPMVNWLLFSFPAITSEVHCISGIKFSYDYREKQKKKKRSLPFLSLEEILSRNRPATSHGQRRSRARIWINPCQVPRIMELLGLSPLTIILHWGWKAGATILQHIATWSLDVPGFSRRGGSGAAGWATSTSTPSCKVRSLPLSPRALLPSSVFPPSPHNLWLSTS